MGSGLLISFHYVPSDDAFTSILGVLLEANEGNLLYLTHSVGAGVVFALVYSHMSKYMLVRSYSSFAILTGSLLLVLLVASAFLGYVLLW